MGWFGPYIYKDKNKVKWWLHSKKRGKTTYYYFSKEDTDALQAIPSGYELTVNQTTGLPLLRKVKRKEKVKESA